MKFIKNKWLTVLIVLSSILLINIFFKQFNTDPYREGFDQISPFVLKRNYDMYDSYYADIYDDLQMPKERVDYEYKTILEMTQPTPDNARLLDIGSGTGDLVNVWNMRGFQAYGIDQSTAMVNVAQRKYPDINTKCGSATDPMAYERGSFTHITCMNFTMYQFQEKLALIRNCYYWLEPNGYFIVHLVDREKYNPIVPAANPLLVGNPQDFVDQRVTDSAINFIDFTYKNKVDFKDLSSGDSRVITTETFQDSVSGKVRQNELTMYMEDLKDIVYMIQKSGFIVQGSVAYINDAGQYIYIFEKQS
jgi:SAM-dependent methyltransferase